jgi:hypothetical protein
LLVGALGLLWLTPAHANVSSDAAFERFMHQSTGAGKQSVGFGGNGTPVVAPGVPSAAADGGAGVRVNNTGSVPNPSGNPVGVSASGRVSNADVAGAIGRLLRKLIFPLSVGSAVYDLMQELGFRQTGASGATWQKQNSEYCTEAPCFLYRLGSAPQSYSTKAAACNAHPAYLNTTTSNYTFGNPRVVFEASFNADVCYTDSYHASNGQFSATQTNQYSSQSTPPVSPVWLASTQQEFLDAIASASGWPSSSAVARAAVQAAETNGERLPVGSPVTVTGPATSPGPAPQVKTEPNTDGSTKTTTTTVTHTHTYNQNVINTTTTTVTNITNNGASGVNTSSTVNSTPEARDERSECEKSPDVIGCSKYGKPPEADPIGRESKDVAISPTAFAAGSCPAPVSFTAFDRSYSFNYDDLCSRLSSLAGLFMALAALVAAWIFADGFRVT